MKKFYLLLIVILSLWAGAYMSCGNCYAGEPQSALPIAVRKIKSGGGTLARSAVILPEVYYLPGEDVITVQTCADSESIQAVVCGPMGIVGFETAENADCLTVRIPTLDPGDYEIEIRTGRDAYSGWFRVE